MAEVTAQAFAYEKRGDSAVILRCFSRDGKAEIPETLDGLPVRALGAYAFSSHLDGQALEKGLGDGRIRISVSAFLAGQPLPPALCGNALEELILPAGVQSVGRYCFYNCARLRALTFSGALRDWGSGVFTGCHGVRRLTVQALPDGTSGLKEVLDELREELCVSYGCREGRALLMFPEFYEEGVENTPARILEDHVHGSGILYRNCFHSRKFDFAQYDALFPYAQANESETLVIRMALGRLRYPAGLSERARGQYMQYLAGHAARCGIYLLDERDTEGIRWFLQLLFDAAGKAAAENAAAREAFDAWTEHAARMGFTEAQSLLMEFAHRTARPEGRKQRRRLEL